MILFGLSMDYHVLILSRVREAYDRGMSTERAVSTGIRATAGVRRFQLPRGGARLISGMVPEPQGTESRVRGEIGDQPVVLRRRLTAGDELTLVAGVETDDVPPARSKL